jgi:aspartate/methionine/tyrosine aminotransferase
MVRVSKRSEISPFFVMEIAGLAAENMQTGEAVMQLHVGQPMGGAPQGAREAAARALLTQPLGYTTSPGLPELRARISRHYADLYGISVDPQRITVVAGASAGFVLAFLACFDVGSRVAVSEPGYPCYRNSLLALGCEPVGIPLGPETSYRPTRGAIEETIKSSGPLDGLVIASPSNPTGTVLSADDLAGIVAICDEQDITLIADEIYHGITFGQGASTVLSQSDSVVVLNSFSKYFGMTGWRLGWIVAPPELVEPLDRFGQNLYICASHVSQVAGLAAFDCADELDARVEQFAQKRRIVLDGLAAAGLTKVAPPDGAFYVYVDVSEFTDDSWALCKQWLDEIKVSCAPGIDFDPVRGHHYVRLSYAGSSDEVTEAMKRIGTWVWAKRGSAPQH